MRQRTLKRADESIRYLAKHPLHGLGKLLGTFIQALTGKTKKPVLFLMGSRHLHHYGTEGSFKNLFHRNRSFPRLSFRSVEKTNPLPVDRLQHPPHHFGDQCLARAEVVVHRCNIHSRGARDLPERYGLKSVLGKQGFRRIENAIASLLMSR